MRVRKSGPWLMALVAVVLASGCGPASVRTIPHPLDLRKVDWNNVSVPAAACYRPGMIQLHDGSVLLADQSGGNPIEPGTDGQKYDQLASGLGPVTYGEIEPGRIFAGLKLWCSNNGGTADGALLYSLVVYSGWTGHLQVEGLVTPRMQPTGVLPTLLGPVEISTGRITVEEHYYGRSDSTCCPTGMASTTWAYSRGNLTCGNTEITVYPRGKVG